MIWLVTLAQLTAPVSTNPSRWVDPQETPITIMPEDVVQIVAIRLTTDPDGKLQNCTVEVSSGIRKLDDLTCKLIGRRARFLPAMDSAGVPTYGVYRTGFNWWYGDNPPLAWPTMPDLDLTVSALPAKTKSPVSVRLMFGVDEAGNMSGCTAESGKTEPPDLVRLGCQELVKSYKATPAKTPQGIPVSSVQTATVTFRSN